jgi:hypothetical protein
MPTTNEKGLFKNLGTAILVTWIVSGTMDGTAAVIQYSINGGKTPEIIFKYIASAVIGPSAYKGGVPMILLGVLFHYIIALGFTLFFYWLYPHISFLGKHPIISGFLYGIFAWSITNLVVVPLSKIGKFPAHLNKAVVALLIIMFCIGLPISLMANKHYLYKK